MSDNKKSIGLDESSHSIQTHLGILQAVVERMASNSTSSKTWCITLVSAILIIVADKNIPNLTFLAFIPTILFFSLDTYYLALEKGFRNSYKSFVKKVHSKTLTPEDLYSVEPKGKIPQLQAEASKSFSVWSFYLIMSILIVVAWVVTS